MTEDMYPSTGKPDESQPPEDGDEGEETGILPLSMFPDDVKPGYKCGIEVVAVHDQEVEVKKGAHKMDKESKSEDVSEDPVGDMVNEGE